MTVKELIEELQRFKPEQEVLLRTDDNCLEEVGGVRAVGVRTSGLYRFADPHGKEAALIC